MPQLGHAETTWLEAIVKVDVQATQGQRILLLTLVNGHRYAIPISPHIERAISPVPVYQPSDLPRNGNGA